MNLATIEARTYARLGWDNANPGAAVVARVRGFINETYRELIGRKGFEQYRRQLIPVVAFTGESIGSLSQSVTKIHSMLDTTNNRVLDFVTVDDIRRMDPNISTAGRPTAYAIYNLSGAVRKQPALTLLYAISTSASDDATKKVYVQGINSDGELVSVSVALNGITEVQIPTYLWSNVTRFYIQIPATQGLGAITPAVGAIYLYTLTGQYALTQIGVIPPGRSSARYSQVLLYPTPTQTTGFTADAEVLVEDLIEEGDEPILPVDFHWLLSSGAVIKEYNRREKPVNAAMERQRFDSGVGDLLMFANRQPNNRLWKARDRWSQLGPWFPPGT